MCTSPLRRDRVPLNILPWKPDASVLLCGLLSTWATAHPATSLIQSSGFLLLRDKWAAEVRERERYWGQAGGLQGNPGQKGCSLSAVVSLAVVFGYAPEKPVDILTSTCRDSRGGSCSFPSLSGSLNLSHCTMPCSLVHIQNHWVASMLPSWSSCWMQRIARSLLKIQVKI